jgi:hypothetical protein
LEDPVDVDLNQVLTSPLIKDFRRLPSARLIEQTIQNQHGNDDLTAAVRVAGASSVATATPEQFMRALNSLFVRSNADEVCAYVGAAVRARPDLADRIVVAALSVNKIGRSDFRRPASREISCEEVDCIIRAAVAAHPSAAREIADAAMAAAPLLRDCVIAAAARPCPPANAFVQPVIPNTVNPANFVPPVVSPEQPTTSSNE